MSDTREINRLNKDEEFEYFKIYNNLNGFQKWGLEEHNIFSKASLDYDFMKSDQLGEILKSVNQHNQNIGSKLRSVDELNIHIRVYQNYLNKQQALRSPTSSLNNGMGGLGGVGSGLGGLSGGGLGSLGGGLSGLGSGGLGFGGNSLGMGGLGNSFLNNIVSNNFQSIIDSLDSNQSPVSSIKDVLSIGNNPLFQKSNSPPSNSSNSNSSSGNNQLPLMKPLELISKPIQQQQQQNTPITRNNKNNNNNSSHSPTINSVPIVDHSEVINNYQAAEINKKDQKLLKEPWTAEDQKKLEEALTKYPSSRFSSVSRWQMVSKELGISPKAAALRYNQMLNQLIPTPKNNPIQSQPTIKNEPKDEKSEKEKDSPSSLGKRRTRSSTSAATTTTTSTSSPNKKEKTSHSNESPVLASTAIKQDTFPNIAETESLLQKNNQLLKQVKNAIMSSSAPQPNVLSEIIENINNSIKITEKWKNNNEMPPLPLKVNDLILTLLSPQLLNSNQNSSFKIPLSKKVNDWNLIVNDDDDDEDDKNRQGDNK